MKNLEAKAEWKMYVAHEHAALVPVLKHYGYELEPEQPHVMGERYVMNAMTTASGQKLVFVGRTASNERVIIKSSVDPDGREELEHERRARSAIATLRFAYEIFATPRELLFVRDGTRTIVVYEFIEQEKTFLERPLAEQFDFALCAFKAQEGARATTHKHQRLIRNVFEVADASWYFAHLKKFETHLAQSTSTEREIWVRVQALFMDHAEVINRYGSFLTHTDFVPHNFRIKDRIIYLLDFSSLRFGNKYDGWARFLNFMALYNPPLEQALTEYVSLNRSEGEQQSLRLMRLYRLTELASFYAVTLDRAGEPLRQLNTVRMHFWLRMLAEMLEGRRMSDDVRTEYMRTRDALRSDDEKKRQQGLH